MSATHHPCDVCRRMRHLSDLRSVGDGRVVCLEHFVGLYHAERELSTRLAAAAEKGCKALFGLLRSTNPGPFHTESIYAYNELQAVLAAFREARGST